MSDDDAYDHTAVDDLGEVLPPGLLPSTLGDLRTLVRNVLEPVPGDDAAASFGGALEVAVARLTAAQRAQAKAFADTVAGRGNRTTFLRKYLNPVSAALFNGWDHAERIDRLRWLGSTAGGTEAPAQVQAMRRAYTRIFGLTFDAQGATNVGDRTPFVVPLLVRGLADNLELLLGSGVTEFRSELEHFIKMVAPEIVKHPEVLGDADVVRCAHCCLDVLPAAQLREEVGSAADWRAAFALLNTDNFSPVAFVVPGTTISSCFQMIGDTFAGVTSIADALGVARSSGPAMLKGVAAAVGDWTMSTIAAVRSTPGSAAEKVASAPRLATRGYSAQAPAALVALATKAGLGVHDAQLAHDAGISIDALASARSINDLGVFIPRVPLAAVAALFTASAAQKSAHADLAAGTTLCAGAGTVRSTLLVQASAGGAQRVVQLASSGKTGSAFLAYAMDIVRTDNCDLILLCSEVPNTSRFHEFRAAQALVEDAVAEVLRAHDCFALKAVPQVTPAALKFIRTGALSKLFGDPAWAAVADSVGAGRVSASAPFDLSYAAGANCLASVFDSVLYPLHGISLRRELLDPLGSLADAGLPAAMTMSFASRIVSDFEARLRGTRNSAPLTGRLDWPSLAPSGVVHADLEQTRRTATISAALAPSGVPVTQGTLNPRKRSPPQNITPPPPGTRQKGGQRPGDGAISKAVFPVKAPAGFVAGQTTQLQLRELRASWQASNPVGCFNKTHWGVCRMAITKNGCPRCK